MQTYDEEVHKSEEVRKYASWLALAVFITVILAFFAWTRPESQPREAAGNAPQVAPLSTAVPAQSEMAEEVDGAEPAPIQVTLPESTNLGVRFGDLGPQLVNVGAIDRDRFIQLYENSGWPLSYEQQALLRKYSDDGIIINRQNARFLLNFFWALGLTNDNPILKEGAMVTASEGDIGRFASTGGWTLGRRPAAELYASEQIILLTPDQQQRLEEVASLVYRPCCNNHTAFPDCNHGMAMLGLLELLAGRDASLEEMFGAAKNMNTFWFTQQAIESAAFFQLTMNLDYQDVDPRMAVGPEVFSGSGAQLVRAWLAENGALEQGSGGGAGCGI